MRILNISWLESTENISIFKYIPNTAPQFLQIKNYQHPKLEHIGKTYIRCPRYSDLHCRREKPTKKCQGIKNGPFFIARALGKKKVDVIKKEGQDSMITWQQAVVPFFQGSLRARHIWYIVGEKRSKEARFSFYSFLYLHHLKQK